MFCDMTPYSPVEFYQLFQKYILSNFRLEEVRGKQQARDRPKLKPLASELLK
jgi:hypothetical protein